MRLWAALVWIVACAVADVVEHEYDEDGALEDYHLGSAARQELAAARHTGVVSSLQETVPERRLAVERKDGSSMDVGLANVRACAWCVDARAHASRRCGDCGSHAGFGASSLRRSPRDWETGLGEIPSALWKNGWHASSTSSRLRGRCAHIIFPLCYAPFPPCCIVPRMAHCMPHCVTYLQ